MRYRPEQAKEAADWVAEGVGGEWFLTARQALELYQAIAAIEAERNALRKDAARLDWMAEHEAWIAWTRDGECCRVFHRDEDGESKPFLGWGSGKYSDTSRSAIDVAIAAKEPK